MKKVIIMLTIFGFLSGCTGTSVPSQPPELSTPPEVAESGFLSAYAEQTIPMTPAELRAFMEVESLIDYLEPTENIANPVAFEVLEGTWGQAGAKRWLRLADGHYVVERVIENEPERFKYQVYIFTNSAGRGVEQIVGEQRFIPVDGGTRFEWSYNVRPKNFITRQIVKTKMEEIEGYINTGLKRFADAARERVLE